MLLTAAVLSLIALPGEDVQPYRTYETTPWKEQRRGLQHATHRDFKEKYQQVTGETWPYSPRGVRVYEHGWPYPFLGRALVYGPDHPAFKVRSRSTAWIRFPRYFPAMGGTGDLEVSWSKYDRWPLEANGWLFRPWHFLIDLAVVSLLVVGIGAFTQWRVVRLGLGGRFRLFDIFIGIFACAAILGFYAYHVQLQHREAPGLSRALPRRIAVGITPPTPPSYALFNGELTAYQRYCGPDWLRKLVGNEFLIPAMHHVYWATISLRDAREGDDREEAYRHLSQFPYLTTVRVDRGLPLTALPYLERCRNLEELVLGPWSQLNLRAGPGQEGQWLGPDNLALLEPLGLSSLTISVNQIQAKHLDQVASFPTLRRLTLRRVGRHGVSISPEQTKAIQNKYPHLKISTE